MCNIQQKVVQVVQVDLGLQDSRIIQGLPIYVIVSEKIK